MLILCVREGIDGECCGGEKGYLGRRRGNGIVGRWNGGFDGNFGRWIGAISWRGLRRILGEWEKGNGGRWRGREGGLSYSLLRSFSFSPL